VKNITVSLPDEDYKRARVRAAEQGTSVSAVVRKLLSDFARQETDHERADRMRREVMATITYFDASDRLTRDEVYDRSRK
jgi:plasmid stability protein